jgi:putative acetyltransferase
MRIRLARNEDCAEIARLRRQTIRSVNSRDYSEEIISDWTMRTNARRFRESSSKCRRWVAVERGRIIGFCDHGFDCELSRIYVHKDYLGRGVGSRLLKVAERSLIKLGCKEVWVESTITAKGFYERNGYKLVRRAVHRTEGTTSRVYKMSKNLGQTS